MKKNRLKWLAGVLMMSFLFGFALSLPVIASESEEGISTNPNLVRGLVTLVRRDLVFVNQEPYRFSLDVMFYDEEEGVVKNGKRKLKRDVKVDLTLKDNLVVKVTIYGLLPK